MLRHLNPSLPAPTLKPQALHHSLTPGHHIVTSPPQDPGRPLPYAGALTTKAAEAAPGVRGQPFDAARRSAPHAVARRVTLSPDLPASLHETHGYLIGDANSPDSVTSSISDGSDSKCCASSSDPTSSFFVAYKR